MLDAIIKLIIGDLEQKQEYRQMMKRVDALPKEYSHAFRKIQKYMYCVGAPNGDTAIFNDANVFIELLELFEQSALDKKELAQIIGHDVAKFADEYMLAFSCGNTKETASEKLNREIKEYFDKRGGVNV